MTFKLFMLNVPLHCFQICGNETLIALQGRVTTLSSLLRERLAVCNQWQTDMQRWSKQMGRNPESELGAAYITLDLDDSELVLDQGFIENFEEAYKLVRFPKNHKGSSLCDDSTCSVAQTFKVFLFCCVLRFCCFYMIIGTHLLGDRMTQCSEALFMFQVNAEYSSWVEEAQFLYTEAIVRLVELWELCHVPDSERNCDREFNSCR